MCTVWAYKLIEQYGWVLAVCWATVGRSVSLHVQCAGQCGGSNYNQEVLTVNSLGGRDGVSKGDVQSTNQGAEALGILGLLTVYF